MICFNDYIAASNYTKFLVKQLTENLVEHNIKGHNVANGFKIQDFELHIISNLQQQFNSTWAVTLRNLPSVELRHAGQEERGITE